MKKFLFQKGLPGAILIIILIVSVLIYRGFSSDKSLSEGLFLHFKNVSWREINIISPNLDTTLSIEFQESPFRVCSLEHGVYTLLLQLDAGKAVWIEFLHHDAGVRKRVDISIQYHAEQDILQVIQTYNQTDELFRGHTKIDATSEESPFRLDWI